MRIESSLTPVSNGVQAMTEQEIDQVGGGVGVAVVVVILVVAGFAIGAGGAYVASLVAKSNR